MLDALEAGLKDKTRALGYLKLGAKVLDRADDTAGRDSYVRLHIHRL